jgi:hypothetical protein
VQEGSSDTYVPTSKDVGFRIYLYTQASNADGIGHGAWVTTYSDPVHR